MANRPFAVFDIDGTLIRWQLYHALVDSLAHSGRLDHKTYQSIRDARMTWKHRASHDSFQAYEHRLVTAYNRAVTSLNVSDFEAAVGDVFDEYKDQVYTYSRDLIKALREKDYLLFAISGSQVEIVQRLADYYGFDAAAGSLYERRDDRFTGQAISMRKRRKVTALKDMVHRFGASYQGSLAIGDSEVDIPLLETAETAIAFNPSATLFQAARQHHWRIVIERKNMVYELEARDGSYLLATPGK